MDNKEAFEAENLDLILSAMCMKWIALGLPLKIGISKSIKGISPKLKPNKSTIIAFLRGGIEPT